MEKPSDAYVTGYAKGTLMQIQEILAKMPESKEREEINSHINNCLEVIKLVWRQ